MSCSTASGREGEHRCARFIRRSRRVETYSPAEEQFNHRRRTIGLFLGPLLLVALIAAPLPIPAPAHRLAGILAMMIVFWVTEALPLAVTAMLGPVLAIILRVAPVRQAFASFADPVIFVFIGGFILAEAMFVHGVDQRIAYTALSRKFVGTSATRIMLVFGGVTMVLSMWMSNTATTAMMYPIGLSICAHLARSGASGARQFALVTMLITSFGASIGGMGTPVGTPPEPHRHRHAGAAHRHQRHLLPVDGDRRAGDAGDVRVRRGAVPLCRREGRDHRRRKHRRWCATS